MARKPVARSIDEYIAGFPEATRHALEEVRAVISAAAPDAVETISYAIPTFDLNGRHLVHFAGYARHVGLYPILGETAEAFAAEVEGYRSGKAALRFPLGEPMPADLIRRIVEYMAAHARPR